MIRIFLLVILLLALAVQAHGQYSTYRGVFFGCNYTGQGINFELEFPEQDAEDMRSAMSSQGWTNTLWQGSDVTESRIRDQVRALPKANGDPPDVQGNTDMFYFAGHGTEDGLWPWSQYMSDVVTPSELFAWFTQNSQGQSVYTSYNRYCCFIDMCHAGVFPGSSAKGVISAGCQADEVTCDDFQWEHSPFTYFLLEGLDHSRACGTDGIVSAEELHEYADNRLQASGRYPYQNPYIIDNWPGFQGYTTNLNFKNSDNQAPAAPTGVTVSGTTGQHPTVSWSANSEGDLAGYKLYRKITPDQSVFSLIAILGTGTCSYSDPECTVRIGTAGQYAYYYVKAYDGASNLSGASSTVSKPINWNPPKTMAEADDLPATYALEQNFPNPFNPSTQIRYSLPVPGHVSLVVCDALGRQVDTLADEESDAGRYIVTWNGSQYASGVYFARLTITDELGKIVFQNVNRLVLSK